MRDHRRRHRPVHGTSPRWVRATCALTLVGTVGLVALRPAPPLGVSSQPRAICSALDAIAALAFQGVVPPVDASPEELSAVRRVNAQLAQMAETVRGLRTTEEGC